VYAPKTASGNLCIHLEKEHAELYKATCEEKGWNYGPKLPQPQVGDMRKSALPPFSPEGFLEYLIRFVAADDQVGVSTI
jgi:hypothetical protein